MRAKQRPSTCAKTRPWMRPNHRRARMRHPAQSRLRIGAREPVRMGPPPRVGIAPCRSANTSSRQCRRRTYNASKTLSNQPKYRRQQTDQADFFQKSILVLRDSSNSAGDPAVATIHRDPPAASTPATTIDHGNNGTHAHLFRPLFARDFNMLNRAAINERHTRHNNDHSVAPSGWQLSKI